MYNQPNDHYIVCAATRYLIKALNEHIVICDARHNYPNQAGILGVLHKAYGLDGIEEKEQGFVLRNGVFVGREQAYKIAQENGQFIKSSFNNGELFSENLY